MIEKNRNFNNVGFDFSDFLKVSFHRKDSKKIKKRKEEIIGIKYIWMNMEELLKVMDNIM